MRNISISEVENKQIMLNLDNIEMIDVNNGQRIKRSIKENEIIYPISINYGKKDWNIVSALREFLSNMLDTKTKYKYKHDGKFAYISDQGKGLTKKDFIFGESTRDNSQIGQFGEGLKMALITLLRLNREVIIKTVGFTVNVKKVFEPIYDSEVMKLVFSKNSKKEGTEIIVECTKKEFENAVNLFLELNENIRKIDKNIYLPSGQIFIMGLNTTTLPNTLFSYNINDKTMTNRDRNIVAADKLRENIIKILNEAKNLKVLTEYLKNIEINPTKYEYQLPIKPKYKTNWKKALKKLYKDKVVLSTDLNSDLYAKMMGYKIMRNVPLHVNNLLKELGVKLSSDVAKNYKGQGLFEKNKIVYPISTDYCSNWNIVDAIREIIANAIDTETDIKVEHRNGKGRIVDSGKGIMKKHLIFGISQKSKNNIGQFGEGLKIASLVFARNKRNISIQTIGYTYIPCIERNDEFDTDLFTVYFRKNQRKKGTVIEFECSKKELEEAKSLFAYFKSKRTKSVKTSKLEIYFNDAGQIYVNGLKTQKIDSVFGYNIKDKTLVISRDRNYVDSFKLSEYISDFLSSTKDENVIEKILTEWLNNNHLFEYRINFEPKNKTIWKKVANKRFKKTCFASYNEKNNFIAKQAGYKILRNIPYTILNILRYSGIESADKIAKIYEDRGIIFENKIIYPIAVDYCSNWTVQDAIREIIANSIDTDSKVTISYKNGTTTISDKGSGIAKKNFLFSSSKKSGIKIGHFGEGLKLSLLVLARNNRDVVVMTKGYKYIAKIERDKEFNADVLVIYIEKCKKRIGTDITFKCSKTELEGAKELFIRFNKNIKQIDNNVYKPGRCLFVNGVFIQNINSLFSYNLTDANDCLSRDRKSIEIDIAKKKIKSIISKTTNKQFIKEFLTCKDHYILEQTLDIKISSSAIASWKKVANKLFSKSCLPTNTEYDIAAIDKGYKLLTNLTRIQIQILRQLGFPYSNEIVTLKGDEKIVRKRFNPNKLSPEGKKRFKKSKKIFRKLYGSERAKKIEIVEEFNYDVVNYSTLGYYNPENEGIYIHVALIEDKEIPFYKLMGTLIHEEVHHISKAPDRTREFENALSYELGRLAEMLIK